MRASLVKRPIRIANCSGYFGDRATGMREMVEGGPIDVLTGDWLAELTMLILAKDQLRNPDGGFAKTFVRQMEDVLGTCLEKGIKIVTNADLDHHPELLGADSPYRLFLSIGHDEYWTKEMRDGFEAARDAGVNLANMGANTAYWQVRYEDDRRTIVGYKSAADPNPDPALKTMLFRALTPPRYECALLGVQHQGGLLDWARGDERARRLCRPAVGDDEPAGRQRALQGNRRGEMRTLCCADDRAVP